MSYQPILSSWCCNRVCVYVKNDDINIVCLHMVFEYVCLKHLTARMCKLRNELIVK